jgi:hypothetical protein
MRSRISMVAARPVLIALFCVGPCLGAQDSIPPAMARAGVVPGQQVKVRLRQLYVSTTGARLAAEMEGKLVDFDSAGLSLRLEDGTEKRIARDEIEVVLRDAGRSRWLGLLAGWVASLPAYAFVCRNAKYECDEGGVVELGGMIVGAVVGWPRSAEVPFP